MTEIEAKEWLANDTSRMKIHTAEMQGENPMEYINSAIEIATKALEEVQQYRALGTVEELKELKDKNTPRELAEHNFQDEVHHYLCPSCRNIVSYNQNYCEECGQRLGE